MAAAPKPLNAQAPEYIPLFNASFITPHFSIPPLIHDISASSILILPPPAFSSPPITLLHPNQAPLHLPPCIHNEPFYTDPFLPQQSSYFPPLPSPPPPPLLLPAPAQEDIGVPPPSPSAVSSPLAISERVRKGPRVIAHKKYHEPKFSRVRAGRGGSWLSGRGRGGRFGKDSSRECVRRGSSSSSSSMHEKERQGDKSRTYVKKHGILPLRSCEEKTTVMIKNIPNEYTRCMLVEFMDKHCMLENQKTKQGTMTLSAYDFLYLPIDFETKMNKGYAFVNFTEPQAVWKFLKACDNTKWDFKNSPKIRRIVCASIQGKEALVKHFQRTDFECESDEFLPLCFSPPRRDGSGDSVKLTPIGNVRGRRYYQTKHRLLV